MTDRPILFSAPMVVALLNGSKHQTRRIMKPQPWLNSVGQWQWERRKGQHIAFHPGLSRELYGKADTPSGGPYAPGDRLWVRESWSAPYRYAELKPREMGGPVWYLADDEVADGDWTRPMPSIHMPRWASRITLEIKDVRVQRLQDISKEDAISEGLRPVAAPNGHVTYRIPGLLCGQSPKSAFKLLWESINGTGSWEANEWVFAISFSVIKSNIDKIAREAA